jgi:hypothetical protein
MMAQHERAVGRRQDAPRPAVLGAVFRRGKTAKHPHRESDALFAAMAAIRLPQ